MKISREEVNHVASLARLSITDDEKNRLTEQLTQILEHIAKLNELNTDNIEPTSHVLAVQNVFREDKAERTFVDANVLDSAPQAEYKHYKVPKIIE